MKLKIGDRVRLRGTKDKGEVIRMLESEKLSLVKWGRNGTTTSTHNELLIRLKHKKRRELFLPLITDTVIGERLLHVWPSETEVSCRDRFEFRSDFIRAVRFVEANK